MHLPDPRKWLGRAERRPAPAPPAAPAARAARERLGLEDIGKAVERSADPEHAAHAAAIEAAAANSAWSESRIEIADRLWGRGFQWPGGAEEVMRVAVPLNLTAASTLLLLGAGGGGAVLRLISELRIKVAAFEADPVLALVAARRIQQAGAPTQRAAVQTFDVARPAFKRQAFQAALAIESLRGPRPQSIIGAMRRAIRYGGQVAIIETVTPRALDPADPAVAAWCRLERREPPPAGTDWVTTPMAARGFELRVAEDMTARHVRFAVTAWTRLTREMKGNRPPPRLAAAVVTEAEYWMRRIDLLTAGKLKVFRWVSIHDGVNEPN